MPDCLSLGGNPSSLTKLYSSLPNLVHGTILCSEGSRSFRGASGLWADLLRDRESADHQPSHQYFHHRHRRHQLPPEKSPPYHPPIVISNRDDLSTEHRCYRTVLLRPTLSSPNPPWLQGPSSWSAVQPLPASVDAVPGARAVTDVCPRCDALTFSQPLCYLDSSPGGWDSAGRGSVTA